MALSMGTNLPPRSMSLSNDSMSTSSAVLSTSPSSIASDFPKSAEGSDSDVVVVVDDTVAQSTNDSSSDFEHIIHLSSIEHCMPRAYIRVCLAYRVPDHISLDEVVQRLDNFLRRTIDAKPYLSGFVVPAKGEGPHLAGVEIRFSDRDFLNFPRTSVRQLSDEEMPYTYDELSLMGLPPSTIRPDLVSALPEGTNDDKAPVFRVQANVVQGGLIVSIYLHHCISDGTGLGFLATGSVLHDDFTFDRHLGTKGFNTLTLSQRLEAFANQKSIVRQRLSWSFPNQISNRHIEHRSVADVKRTLDQPRPTGRGCIFAFPRSSVAALKSSLDHAVPNFFTTTNDALQAFLWHHMTQARRPSLADNATISTSKLLIPVNIRKKLKEALSENYFGAAVDFASAQLSLDHLSKTDAASLAQTALSIRNAISQVDEAYIRQAIALARISGPSIDVRDLMGSNMDRVKGADMYITSWEKLNLYDAQLELGLGRPDFVRKPWSKDPGSCIILPMDARQPYTEVLVQLTEVDMERLLKDEIFMDNVSRTID